MNQLRKYSGLIWLAMALFAGYFSITSIGLPKFASGLTGNQSDMVFGIIVLIILTPLIVGAMLTFGYYALSGDYDR